MFLAFDTGLHITFANHWTVSIQWGERNYSNDCATAEIAAWHGERGTRPWYHFDNGNEVLGWQTPEEVIKWLAHFSSLPDAPQ